MRVANKITVIILAKNDHDERLQFWKQIRKDHSMKCIMLALMLNGTSSMSLLRSLIKKKSKINGIDHCMIGCHAHI